MGIASFRASAWYRLWRPGSPAELVIDDAAVLWRDQSSSAVERVLLADLLGPPTVAEGMIWSRLVIPTRSGARLFAGLSRTDAAASRSVLSQNWATHQRRAIIGPLRERAALLREWDDAGSRWIRSSWAQQWRSRAQTLAPVTPSAEVLSLLTPENRALLSRFDRMAADVEAERSASNSRYEAWALFRYSSFFDTVEARPLTAAQRLACIRDEDNNLVLAGAGSGKTSVIVARAAHLVDAGLADPSEILILAFNTDAAHEVRARLGPDAGPTVATFHAFGKRVATAGVTRQPAVSRLAEDEANLAEFVLAQVLEMAGQDGGHGHPALRAFMEHHLAPVDPAPAGPSPVNAGLPGVFGASTASGRTLKDAVNALSRQGRGMATRDYRYRVRSNQEVLIANFLFLSQVEYEYEPDYVVQTATKSRRQYRPDFYLPEYDLYLEHFAVAAADQRGIAWGSNASLVECEELQKGWQPKQIEITDTGPDYGLQELAEALGGGEYSLADLELAYHEFLETDFWRTNTKDATRLMLRGTPGSGTDDPGLQLRVSRIKWSQLRFFWEKVLPASPTGSLAIRRGAFDYISIGHPNSLCLHLILLDRTGRVMVTRLTSARHDNPGTWACSIGEQLDPVDLSGGVGHVSKRWVERAVAEEIPGLESLDIPDEAIHFLALNLESEIANYTLVCVARLPLDAEEILARARSGASPDQEVVEMAFLDMDSVPMEMLYPKLTDPQHPSTGIRLMFAYLSQHSYARLGRALLNISLRDTR